VTTCARSRAEKKPCVYVGGDVVAVLAITSSSPQLGDADPLALMPLVVGGERDQRFHVVDLRAVG